jgi:hypothetical protein
LKEFDRAVAVMEAGRSQFPHPLLARELGTIYFLQENFSQAIEVLRDYMDTTDKAVEPAIYIVLARAQHGAGDVNAAVATLEDGLQLYPDDEAILSWLKKFGREHAVEGDMATGSTWHFEIRFQNVKEQEEVRRRVLAFLEEAYVEVTRRFSFYPEESTPVVLYESNDQMLSGVEGATSWMAACYNGKMRIPLKDTELPDDRLRELLRHEFTHAIVGKIAKGTVVPCWLNEGLAQILEGEDAAAALADVKEWAGAAKGAGQSPAIPFAALAAGFNGLSDRRTVRQAYAQSLLFTQYLEQKFGFWKVQQIVESLGEGYGLEDAITYTLGGDLKSHEQKWIKSELQGY